MSSEFDDLLVRANKGRTASQIELAHCYMTGTEPGGSRIEVNEDEARKWLEAAHDAGAATATLMLGSLYENGTGVQASFDRALALFTQAAEAGSFLACVHAARLHRRKAEADSNANAVMWYERALSFEDEVGACDELDEAKTFLDASAKT